MSADRPSNKRPRSGQDAENGEDPEYLQQLLVEQVWAVFFKLSNGPVLIAFYCIGRKNSKHLNLNYRTVCDC